MGVLWCAEDFGYDCVLWVYSGVQRTLAMIICYGCIPDDVVFTVGCAMKALVNSHRTLGLPLQSTSPLLRYDCRLSAGLLRSPAASLLSINA